MSGKSYFLLCVLLCGLGGGCASVESKCQLALFPYAEYSYKAESRPLASANSRGDLLESVEFCALKIPVMPGWQYEKPFDKTLHLFTQDKSHSVIASCERSTTINPQDLANIKLVGCDCSKSVDLPDEKSSKDFYNDIYLFTADQMDSIKDPTLWHYYILWSKTSMLRDATEMIHYQGNNLDAFRHDADTTKNVKTMIALFPKKAGSNYCTIAGTFHDSAFFDRFVDMIEQLN